MDFALFSLINRFAHSSLVFDWISIFFATYALPLFMATVLIASIWKKNLLSCAFFGSIFAFGSNALIGFLFFRPRPFVDHSVIQLIEKDAIQKSFPSDHAALSFALAASVSALFPRMSMVVYTLAIFISLSRIVVGVHYPSDVVMGAIIGIASVVFVRKGLRV